MDFKNKIVLVTGGSRGIGKATASEFAARGAKVIINYKRNDIAAKQTLQQLAGTGHIMIKANINDPGEIEEMFHKIDGCNNDGANLLYR